jgi:protein transport protein SEC24
VGPDMNIDNRVAGMSLFNTMSVAELVWTLYPRMYPLHQIQEVSTNLKGETKLPAMIRTSYERLDEKGCYLLDTGSDLYLWLGRSIPTELVHSLFGVDSINKVDSNMVSFVFQKKKT